MICHCHFCDWYRVLLAASKTVHVGCSENMPSVREMPQWTKLAKMWVGQSGQKVGSIAAQCVRTRDLGGHQVDTGLVNDCLLQIQNANTNINKKHKYIDEHK